VGILRAFLPLAQLAFIAMAAGLVFVFVSAVREGELRRRCGALCIMRPNYAGANRRAPDFELKDIDGKTVSSRSLAGKVVVLNFWTKTCGPCMEEMPALAELAKVLKPRRDVEFVTISTDEDTTTIRDVLSALLREAPPFTVLVDSESEVVNGKFGTRLYPETWIVDKSGVVRARFDGVRDWSNAAIVELVDQVRAGGYCPVEIQFGKVSGEAAKLCEGSGA
jgi:thiol-disulfide isomerase/thioredoxin